MTNGFALTHNKSLQIYFFKEKRHVKSDFLQDVKNRVVYWFINFSTSSKHIFETCFNRHLAIYAVYNLSWFDGK